ncbi:DUF6093 family protein [Microbacterium sp. NPDC088619]|uniref:DUF6093 family protein n=1 Tax=Microbacterium sp. NPDC088619 TaxID=3364196 RepID=UPI00382CD295
MSVLQRGRESSERRMTETVQSGPYKSGTDPDSGDATNEIVSTTYSGKGRIKYETTTVSDSDTSSQTVASQRLILSIPTDSPRLQDGDGVTVSASLSDELLIGRFYTVEGSPESGQTTSHRYPLKELS